MTQPLRPGESFTVYGDPNTYVATPAPVDLPQGYVMRSAEEIREAAAKVCERIADEEQALTRKAVLRKAATRIRRLALAGMYRKSIGSLGCRCGHIAAK